MRAHHTLAIGWLLFVLSDCSDGQLNHRHLAPDTLAMQGAQPCMRLARVLLALASAALGAAGVDALLDARRGAAVAGPPLWAATASTTSNDNAHDEEWSGLGRHDGLCGTRDLDDGEPGHARAPLLHRRQAAPGTCTDQRYQPCLHAFTPTPNVWQN